MEQLLTYLPDVLTWSNLLVLVCGSIGGLFFGAMPGLSSPNHGCGPAGALHLLHASCSLTAAPGRRVYFRRGRRVHLGHPAEHSGGPGLHRHPA